MIPNDRARSGRGSWPIFDPEKQEKQKKKQDFHFRPGFFWITMDSENHGSSHLQPSMRRSPMVIRNHGYGRKLVQQIETSK